jgi:hypothetical protein
MKSNLCYTTPQRKFMLLGHRVKMWLPYEDVKSAGPCTVTAGGRRGRAFVADTTVQHMALGWTNSLLNVKWEKDGDSQSKRIFGSGKPGRCLSTGYKWSGRCDFVSDWQAILPAFSVLYTGCPDRSCPAAVM